MKRSPEEGRLALVAAIQQTDGNLVRVAHLLDVTRWHVYRLVYKHRLWEVVNRARVTRISREADGAPWQSDTRRALTGRPK